MYTRLAEIRTGRDTVVWRAQHAATGRRVTVKEPADGLPAADRPRVVNLLEREYRFLEQLNSPGIARPVQWEEGGRLLVEDAQGNLDRLLEREGKVSVDLVARVMVDCLTGLAHLHERKLAHGSLCTTSVLVTGGDAKLGDFVGFRVDQSHAPPAPEYLLRYKAPELLSGATGGDPPDVRAARIDLYALGFLACELLTGRDNFDRIFWPTGVPREADANWLWWHGDPTKEFPPLETVLPDVSGAMLAVLRRLIAKNPALRPRSAREVSAELHDANLLSNRKLPALDGEPDEPVRRRRRDDDEEDELPAGRHVTVVRKTTLELWPAGAEIHAVRLNPKNPALIGHGKGCRFRLPEALGVDEKHALLVCQDTGHWWVYDLRSKLGVEVDGRKRAGAELPEGATLRVPAVEGVPGFTVKLVQSEDLLPDIRVKEKDGESKFELGKKLHAGQSGDLFLARWQGRNRLAAVRVFPPQFATDTEGLRRFIERIPEAGRMKHPNLVGLYRGGFMTRGEQRTWFLATEYLAGGSLRDRLARAGRPLPVDDALRTGIDIAGALGEVSNRQMVHRNVNPASVLYDDRGTAKLGDFFLLRDEEVKTLHQITQAQTPQGECVYQAPEVLSGLKRLTPACDVYSLAACLYEALTRRPPFNPEQGMMALYNQIQETVPEPPQKFNAAVPDRLSEVLMRALSKDPGRRPAVPDELRLELQRLQTATRPAPA